MIINSILSFFFILGFHWIGKKVCLTFNLNKINRFVVSASLIQFISFVNYILYNFKINESEILNNFLFYFLCLIGLLYFFTKISKINFFNNIKYINFFYILILLNIFISCIVPVTDADSVRYHLGQFNLGFQDEIFNLHSKISFIGDGLNATSFYSKSYNIVSLLNFYSLFILFRYLIKKYPKNKYFFLICALGSPILLNLMISQKPYFWLLINLFYIIIFKDFFAQKLKSLFLIFLNISFILISKPEFFLIVPPVFLYLVLSFKKTLLRFTFKTKIHLILTLSFFPLNFFLSNYILFNDPLKIFLIKDNSYLELAFLNYLSTSNLKFNLKSIIDLVLNLGIPYNFKRYFTASLGIAFLINIFYLDIKNKDKKLIFLILTLIIINLLTERINVQEAHARNYFLIFLLIIFLNIDIKILHAKLIKVLLIFQLLFTQFGFIFFNYQIYIKKIILEWLIIIKMKSK